MDYPLAQPIRNHDEAQAVRDSLLRGRTRTLDESDVMVDRLIEIVAFRTEQLWQELYNPALRGPTVVSFAFPGPMKTPDPLPREFNGAYLVDRELCHKHLGHSMGELFRIYISERFACPIGVYPHDHFSRRWPVVPVTRGPLAVLNLMMTPAHRIRREAALLEQSTPSVARPASYRRF